MCIIAHASGGNEELLANVNKHIQEGQPKKALKVLESGISDDPENYVLLLKRAEIYILLNKDGEALNETKKVLKQNPECSPALLLAAEIHTKHKELEHALELVESAFECEADPSTQQALWALKGKILLHTGHLVNAEECLLIASSSDGVSVNTLFDLAKVFSKREKMDEAIVVLESSIERFGLQMNTLVLAGTIQNKRGKYDDAINYLDLALTIDGENPTALAALAEAYMYIDDLTTAEQKLIKAIESDENSAYAHKVYGDYLMLSDDSHGACGEYNLAVENGYAEQHGQVEILFLLTESCGLD
jgi:tetratricopeptide (TPR) repeat protein